MKGLLARLRQPLQDSLRNRLRLSAYNLGPAELRAYLKRIAAFKPIHLYAYTSAAYLLAREAEAAGFRQDSLKAVLLSAEPVFPHVARCVERAFGVPALVEYGSVETGVIAAESPDRTLRVREDGLLLETVAGADGRFDILVTVLNNPSFPLLRYALGDSTAQPLHVPERGWAILQDVVGRKNDMILSRTGRYVHPFWLDELFSRDPAVSSWQIRQQADGSVSIKVAETSSGTLDAAALVGKVEQMVEGYPVQFEVVRELPRSGAGKHRWIQSDLAPR